MDGITLFLGLFGGLSLFFWTLTKTLPELKRAGLLQPPPPKPIRVWQIRMPFLDARQVQVSPLPSAAQRGDSVLEELRALRGQMEQMQSTCHQFDISFDAALTRLEERVHRVEIKQINAQANTQASETPRVRLSGEC